MSKYITYHNHTTMSLLDSCLKVQDLVKWAKANNMNAVGVTEHGEMSSHIDLYKECQKENIKPILGIEFYVTENKLDEEGKKIRDNWHLIALAKNLIGWHNIIKLHNLSYREERYYYDPRITFEDLIAHKEGLIITSACIGGVIGKQWLQDNPDKSTNIAKILKNEFQDDFYLELQNHNAEDLKEREKNHQYNKFLRKLSKELNIKCVIQNDSHYYLKEHWEGHQVLLCKNTGSKMSNPKFKFDSKEYYLKNEAEMVETFNEYPLSFINECIDNTYEISDKIECFNIINDKYDCPTFGEPEETFRKLADLTKTGLLKRFSKSFLVEHSEYIERLKEELSIVKKVGYVDYFLMLDDLYKFTKKEGIYLGIGRGSAGGSLVLYCLGIIDVDPIKYNLLFSRFINEDRISMADFDLDVSDSDRPRVVQYLKNRYGEDHVCNIGTYGELTAKASFKAVCSVLSVPFDKANSLSAMMNASLTLQENYDTIDTFRCACQNDTLLGRAFEIAKILEGTYAQRGTHACGMLISSKPLDDVCACVTVKDTKSNQRIVSTSFPMKQIDGDLKLLKLDILGLTTLNIIQNTDKLIKNNTDTNPDFKNLDINDKKTYDMLSNGFTSMVFQFESALMQRIIKQVRPKSIEDLSCITSLARPGALDSGLTEQYIRRRNGQEEVIPLVEGTEQYMEDTLQLPIYQENIMQISRVMAGFTGAEADTLRKCITGDSIISLDDNFISIEEMYKNKNKYIGNTIFSTNKQFKTVKDSVVDIFDNGIADVYKLKTQKGYELKCTDTHELMMLDKFRKLKDIKIGDSVGINLSVLNSDIIWDKIVSIEYIGKEHVYDLQTKNEHNYIANGIVVHNCIGKKNPEKLKSERQHFVDGAVSLGHTKERANEIFDIAEKFGGYGFNKSHAVGYSLLSYATAYYKANYPYEFVTSVLNSVADDLDKLNLYIAESLRMGIEILPPDINESGPNFTLTSDHKIRFGLNAIKGLGKTALKQISQARKNGPFKSVVDFIERTQKVDKSNLQALLRVGAFNTIEQYPKRWDVMADYITEAKNSKVYQETTNLERTIQIIVGRQKARKSEEYLELANLKRELGSSRSDKLKREEYNEQQEKVIDEYINKVSRYFLQFTKYKTLEKISNEQELLGFNVSTNPYKRWNDFRKYFTTDRNNVGIPYIDFGDLMDNLEIVYEDDDINQFVTVALLSDIKEFKTKKGQRMAKLTVEYYGKKSSITCFGSQWENDIEFKVQKGCLVAIFGRLTEANMQYSDTPYEIRLSNIRQLNVLVNENNKCIINLKNRSKSEIDGILKSFANQEKVNNLPIEKCVIYQQDDKYMVTYGMLWVNNADKLAEKLK